MIYGAVGIGILAMVVVVLGARLRKYSRQVEHLLSQMDLLEQEDTNYKLSSCCRVGRTEELVRAFNRIIQLDRDRMAELRKGNNSYRESIISISHDIRTPLTSAKGYIQMLLKNQERDVEKQRAYLDNIEHRIDDVTDMLTQLFEYARIEADELVFETDKLNVTNLFADVTAMFYEDFMQKGCEPVIEIAREPCYICADRQGVRRIMENLLKNALAYGTGDYRFSILPRDNKVEIIVSNRTDAIEKEDVERIFERFYTTDRSRTRKTTGLGLAIVKQFAQKMGGEAYAELTDGTFRIKIVFPRVS